MRAVDDHAAVVFRSIDSLRAPAEGACSEPTDVAPAERLFAALKRLTTALDAFDPSLSSESLSELAALGAPAAMRTELARIRQLVDDYQFDAAAEAVAELVRQAGAMD
jgi:hypothetical protein